MLLSREIIWAGTSYTALALLNAAFAQTSHHAVHLELFVLNGRLQEHARVVRHHNIHAEMKDKYETMFRATLNLLDNLISFCVVTTCGGVSRPVTMI